MIINLTFLLDKLTSEIGNPNQIEQMIVSTTNNSGWGIRVNRNNAIDFEIYDGTGSDKYTHCILGAKDNETVQANDFQVRTGIKYNLTAIYDGNKLKLYLNGGEKVQESEGSEIYMLTQQDYVPTMIGANPRNNISYAADSNYYLYGKVYNVKLWYDVGEWFNDSVNEEKIIDYLYEQAIKN